MSVDVRVCVFVCVSMCVCVDVCVASLSFSLCRSVAAVQLSLIARRQCLLCYRHVPSLSVSQSRFACLWPFLSLSLSVTQPCSCLSLLVVATSPAVACSSHEAAAFDSSGVRRRCLLVFAAVCVSVCLCVCLSVCLTVCRSLCRCLSLYLSDCLCVSVSLLLFVSFSLPFSVSVPAVLDRRRHLRRHASVATCMQLA